MLPRKEPFYWFLLIPYLREPMRSIRYFALYMFLLVAPSMACGEPLSMPDPYSAKELGQLPPSIEPTLSANSTISGGVSCSNDSGFIGDISVLDNTSINSGEAFSKVWRFQNNGSCAWTKDYAFVFVEGDQMGAPSQVNLEQDVPPSGTYDISVIFTAPDTPGTYRSTWQLSAPNDTLFGSRAWVQIIVIIPPDSMPEGEAETSTLHLEPDIFRRWRGKCMRPSSWFHC